MNKSPLTKHGEAQLRQQLHNLKTTERQRLRQCLEEARAHGDLKENAEYHAAKEEQSLIEARISYLESQLQTCTVVDISQLQHQGKVMFGATVTLENIDTEKSITYQLVGEPEADIEQGKISYRSPIAQACIGQQAEDILSVETPQGQTEYEITNIAYIE